ncbi:MAG TPA: LPS assembly lipoprotein LptE [Planctomycetaceae bacterium]|nr:LPS assembly lipoprotein LptE [Planctomycetaceae bacterium]
MTTRPLADRALVRLAPLLWLAGAAAGCGYMVGAPIGQDIRTISVPIAASNSFRRGVEFQLTEAVHRQIQTTTQLRLANEPFADARLTVQLVEIDKDVLGETRFDDPRELQVSYAVLATLVDLRTGAMICQEQIPLSPEALPLVGRSEFAPEVGHSLATGQQRALDDLARQIVEKLEVAW